jgi:hypothetical protein
MSDHGASTIKEWMQGLIETARSGQDFETSAGAEPGRAYSYLEYRRSDGRHSVLLFAVDPKPEKPLVKAYRFEGSADEVRKALDKMVPEEDRPAR